MNDNIGKLLFDYAQYIKINYNIQQKQDYNVTITKLLNNAAGMNSSFANETDIDSIPNLISETFNLKFNMRDIECFFKKSNNTKLLLFCLAKIEEDIYLGKIENETILYDINYKYNFRLKPVENYDIIHVSGYDTRVGLVYPEILNFTSEIIFTLRYIMNYPYNSRDIKCNPDSDSVLKCYI